MAIVINGSGTVTGLAVGGLPDGTVDAGTLATNSVDSAELIDGAVDDSHMASISGRRNMIINGAMQVAQRSSATGLTNGSGGTFGQVDRWRYNESGSPSSQFTLSHSSDSPNTFGNSLAMDCTTSGSGHNVVELEYRVEAQDLQGVGYGTSSAKQITLSFWVKSNQTGTGNVGLYRLDNTPRHAAGNYTISSADTWEYKTITYAADTSQAVDNDNGIGMKIWFTLGAASNYNTSTGDGTWGGYADGKRGGGMTLDLTSSTNDYIKITGLQMELGSTATEYEHKSYAEELALCQRYYQRIEASDGDFYVMASKGQSTDATRFAQTLAVPLRASPTISQGGGIGTWRVFRPTAAVITSSNTPTTVGFVQNAGFVSLQINGFSGISDNYFYGTSPAFSSSGYFDMDSEL